ncbi:MAG: aminoacyl-tRNA deacylase [Myxococcota bacterium]
MIEQVRELLRREGVYYEAVPHPPAFTAHELAHQLHAGDGVALKVVVVELDGKTALCVVPAYARVDLHRLAEEAGAHRCTLVPETRFAHLFPGCEAGAMPPLGSLWGLPVFADARLCESNRVVFPAGSHAEGIRISCADFLRVSGARLVEFERPLAPA